MDEILDPSIAQRIATYMKTHASGYGTSDTVFDCVQEPEIGILEYIKRFQTYTKCTDDVLVIAMCYVLKIVNSGRVKLARENVHRLLLGCCTIAYKWNEDEFYNNPFCARVGGVRKEELVDIEVTIMKHMEFNAYIDKKMYKETIEELYKYQFPLD